MRVIGITGGVGSGKSYVAHRLRELYQAELLVADDLGHVAMEPGTEGYRQIIARFGAGLVMADQTLDRKELAQIIFQDEKALRDMNAIVHPIVKQYIEDYIKMRKEKSGTILLETALMYETGCDAFCDEVWYVFVPVETRVRRLQEDRGYSKEKSRSIIAKQRPEDFFRERADRLIDNSGGKQELEVVLQVLRDCFI